MDANATKYHLLLGHDDWGRCSIDGTPLQEVWTASSPLSGSGKLRWNKLRDELTLEQRLFKFVAAPRDTYPALDNRRGAAADVYNNWYWIDETEHKILIRSSGSGTNSTFWPVSAQDPVAALGDFRAAEDPQPSAPVQLRGLTVTKDHYLVAGTIDPAGLYIFDLSGGGPPRWIVWPAEIPFSPFDISPHPGGGVLILDRENKCLWRLDRTFNFMAPNPQEEDAPLADFQSADNTRTRPRPTAEVPACVQLADSPEDLIDPIAIEALPDGSVFVLDHDPRGRIYRYRNGQKLDDEISTEAILPLIEQQAQKDFSLTAYDLAFVPGQQGAAAQTEDRLYVVSADGNQSFAFRICLRDQKIELQPIAEYLPMRLFGGKGLMTTGAGVYYDFADTWIPLVQQRRPRYVQEATLDTPIFDGVDPDCTWHRLMVDAHLPPETRIEVWSRAANEERYLSVASWHREPDLYLRRGGSELPFLRFTDSAACAAGGNGTWELLFQRAAGRFLQLRLRLVGSGRNTPHLRALRAYYPRFSYVTNYLPAIYREDDQSASFLDRFLANVEGLYTSIEDKIAAAQVLFDVRSAPAEVLEWLAGWFGIALDPAWDEQRRRIFIKHAMEFFQFRGTIRGLQTALHLALDPCADETIFTQPTDTRAREQFRIVEKYLTRTTPGVIFGDPSELRGPRSIQSATRWQPQQGRSDLIRQSADFQKQPTGSVTTFPLTPPADAGDANNWRQFAQSAIGFVPFAAAADRAAWQSFLAARYGSVSSLNTAYGTSYSKLEEVNLPLDLPPAGTPQDDWTAFVSDPTPASTPVVRGLWQDFLGRRYGRVKALNQAYGTKWPAFELVSLPDQLPSDGAPLTDWYQFESVVMPMRATAHRFTVLLPVPLSVAFDPGEHQQRLALAKRIVELEKPAHTVFDVKFYWAMFRIGDARLEFDTVIDQGSRAPQLLPRLALDQGYLGESYLAPPPFADARDRSVIGGRPLSNPHKEKKP